MAELKQELYGLTARHDAVFQLIAKKKYRANGILTIIININNNIFNTGHKKELSS
jgi:hypothetical protein